MTDEGPSEKHLAKIRAEIERTEQMPPEWRVLVYEYGLHETSGARDASGNDPVKARAILERQRREKQI